MKMKKNLRFNNTYEFGTVTYLIFKDKDKYIGVCLEFDLETEGETPKEAKERIEDYCYAWLENVTKKKLPEELLNKPAPKKYWDMLQGAKERIEKRQTLTAGVIASSQVPALSCFQFYYPPNATIILK